MTLPKPALHPPFPDRARRIRWRYYLARFLMVALLVLGAGLLVPGGPREDRLRYREGDIARDRVVAPYDFLVQKDMAALRREQEQAALKVAPVYVVDPRVTTDDLARFAAFQEKVLRVVGDPERTPEGRVRAIRGMGVPLSDETLHALTAPGRARRVVRDVSGWLGHVLDAGLVADKRGSLLLGHVTLTIREGEAESTRAATSLFDRREALSFVEGRARANYPGDERTVRSALELVTPFLTPNVLLDRAETEWRKAQARGAVLATLGSVQKDELLVDANQRIDRLALRKLITLRELEAARRSRTEFLYPPVARMLLMFLFIAIFATYLRAELPQVYSDNSQLGAITLLTSIVLLSSALLVGVLGLSEFMVPVALGPLVVGSLLEKRPALVYTLLLAVAVLSVAEMRAPFIPVAVMGGVTAVYSVTRLRHRWHFFRAMLMIALANLAAILAWDLARVAVWPVLLQDVGAGVANAFGATTFAFLLLPVVEHVFALTSDVTLLELSDLNRPILKRVQLEAPGTYHHSMVVGNLAEAAAEAVGANSLLARVCAYYHDIGKISRKEYYGENETTPRSLHDELSASMSALILRSHIKEGLELARKERLPRAVQNGIQEHHGTMVMAFFYDKALQSDPTARREDFCYPGPKPRSKETAILMLADGVEGAARSLVEPTSSRIKGLVASIIEQRVQAGQLDECGLTLQDLARVRDAFFPVLRAVFHVRAPYPAEPVRGRADADLRRESTS